MRSRQVLRKTIRVVILLILGILAGSGILRADTGNIDPTDKWAWGEEIGWSNFRPPVAGATVAYDGVYGYIWHENIGWVKLAYDSHPPYENTSNTDWGVNNDGDGNLSGYGWSERAGWINFNPPNSQVVIGSNGNFYGYAWGENVGWVNFSSLGSVDYKVKTDWTWRGSKFENPISVSLNYSGSGYSSRFGNNYEFYSCVTFPETGPDVVYSFTIASAGRIRVTLSGLSADLDLFLTNAPSAKACVAGSTNLGTTPEEIEYEAVAGTYYVVVDGYDLTSGSYDIDISYLPPITPTPTPLVTPTPEGYHTPTPTPMPTPEGYHTLTPTPFTPVPTPLYLVLESGDYNGDGWSDIAIFRPDTGLWAVRDLERLYFGTDGDIPASGDYDGNGYTNVAIFRPGTGLWAIKNLTRVYFGSSDDMPIPQDYDGDGTCDIAVFRAGTSCWAMKGITRIYYGASGDLPVPGDYDSDGSAEIAIFRPATGLWSIRGYTRCYYGADRDIPVAGAYRLLGFGVGAVPWTTDIAIFRPSSGLWAIREYTRIYYGTTGDVPVVGDFGANHPLDDIAIFRPSSGLWAVRGTSRIYYGASGDIPVTR